MSEWNPQSESDEELLAVAIVGMAGRFPGAPDLDIFWQQLRDGVEGISFFTEEELRTRGVDPAAIRNPRFVKASPVLTDIDRFDASFFGYAPTDAALLDPQHRLFLECCWAALEHAGYDASTYGGMAGVYAGTSLSTYLLFNLLNNSEITAAEDTFPVMVGNDKDFLATRVSYHLNLKGPSIDLQTGCSTSLVAVHLACQSLLTYQCDMGIAGGVSVNMPQRSGYYYQEGGIASPDGHCRAFDAEAQGTIFGSGVGVVVLKRLEDALADGDTIHAVIRGSAINNDGAAKVGYTAPSVDGQAEVIARAQTIAGVNPETISYVEAHGTATPLGDPVEVAALTRAFRSATTKIGYCGLGSVKSNIGHLDAAAGIASLIKTVLALKHRQIPPSLHFSQPNPRIDFASSPFYVNAELSDWPTGSVPRRAGVSSFGIGGTNAHVILEEAPPPLPTGMSGDWQLLTLSAKTSSALEASTAALIGHLRQHPQLPLADAAYTLQLGRKAFDHRRIIVCNGTADALRVLESRDPQHFFTLAQQPPKRSVVFMFPGGGAQYVGMGAELYRDEPVFRQHLDRCAVLLQPQLGLDLRALLYPARPESAPPLTRTALALPALFAVEYALAQLWLAWGIKPQALIGHSLGEYTAACLAGVFTLEDALALVVLRGRLFEQLPGGAMLSLALPDDELASILPPARAGQLSVAAVNGPGQCVIAGTIAAIDDFAADLTEKEIEFRRIQIDVAAHSHLITPILNTFAAFVQTLKLSVPTIPLISNVTGTWITAEEATDPQYWVRHLRQTVRFGDGVRELLQEPDRLLLEVGPGRTLTTLAKLQATPATGAAVLSSLRHPQDRVTDYEFVLTSLGKLWLAGGGVDWTALYRSERRQRLPLPTYPFEGERYWIAPDQAMPGNQRRLSASKQGDIADWFYLPGWQRASLPLTPQTFRTPEGQQPGCWLIFLDHHGLGALLHDQMVQAQQEVIGVSSGAQFAQLEPDRYIINPHERQDYRALLHDLRTQGKTVRGVVHLWSFAPDLDLTEERLFQQSQILGFYSLLWLTQALVDTDERSRVHICVVTSNAQEVESTDQVVPEQAPLLAACKVIPQEHEQISCRYIDARSSVAGTHAAVRLAQQVLAELRAETDQQVIAYRGGHRWVQMFEPMRLEAEVPSGRQLRKHGVYLITGGLGGVSLQLADYLARTFSARLVLVARTPMPARSAWDAWLALHDADDPVSRKLRAVQALEAHGSEVLLVSADVAEQDQMQAALDETYARFGTLHGVMHMAGLAGAQAVSLIGNVDQVEGERHFQAKVQGTYVLERTLADRQLDFCLLFSSNAAILGGPGLVAYAAANAFLDGFAISRSKRDQPWWLSANWDGWLSTATSIGSTTTSTNLDQCAMRPDESVDAFCRLVTSPLIGQVVVSTGDLAARQQQWLTRAGQQAAHSASDRPATSLHARPAISTEYVPASTDMERTIIAVWQELLGIDQLGIYDNFFDLGGNSLLGLKIVARLKKELQVDVPIVALFEGPTVRALAEVLRQAQTAEPSYEQNQSRGERRRERHNRRRPADDSLSNEEQHMVEDV